MMMESRMSRGRFREWLGFGGAETLESYGLKNGYNWDEKISPSHWQFLESTKSFHVIDDFIFVHAGLEMSVPLESQDPSFLFWRKFEIPEPYSKTQKVFCGHTARKNGKIIDFGHTICLDTYAYGGKWLSCLNVDNYEFLQANCEGNHFEGIL
jgi:serine/threonine protein phosphatase 1